MSDWRDTLTTLTHAGAPAILVTRIMLRSGGEDDGRLVVADQVVAGSVGDDLHEDALSIAQALLHAGATGLMRHHFHDITLLFEPVPPVRFRVALFGASAVARATVRLLGDLPCRTDWFLDAAADVPVSRPGNVTLHVEPDLAAAVALVSRGAVLVVMTDDHADDYAIVAAALARPDLSSVLLLGNAAKRDRFAARLAAAGLADAVQARLICPLGVSSGRRPAEIAIGAAARLLEASALPVSVSRAYAA